MWRISINAERPGPGGGTEIVKVDLLSGLSMAGIERSRWILQRAPRFAHIFLTQ